MKIIYAVRILQDGFWKHIGTYWEREVAEKDIANIIESSAKKWRSVEGVRLSQRHWIDEEPVQEWTKEQKP